MSNRSLLLRWDCMLQICFAANNKVSVGANNVYVTLVNSSAEVVKAAARLSGYTTELLWRNAGSSSVGTICGTIQCSAGQWMTIVEQAR